MFLLLIPAFLVAVNVPPLLAKNLPKDFWKNPITKLKGGTPYTLFLALTGTALTILAQFYSVVKRAGRLWMKKLGAPKAWLTIHVILDFVGPLLILVHAGLLSNPKFINLNWLTHSFQNSVAGIPALMAPVAMVSGLIGRYFYRRLPILQRQFKHWRRIHIALTAIFYVAGITHVLINTKGVEAFLGLSRD